MEYASPQEFFEPLLRLSIRDLSAETSAALRSVYWVGLNPDSCSPEPRLERTLTIGFKRAALIPGPAHLRSNYGRATRASRDVRGTSWNRLELRPNRKCRGGWRATP